MIQVDGDLTLTGTERVHCEHSRTHHPVPCRFNTYRRTTSTNTVIAHYIKSVTATMYEYIIFLMYFFVCIVHFSKFMYCKCFGNMFLIQSSRSETFKFATVSFQAKKTNKYLLVPVAQRYGICCCSLSYMKPVIEVSVWRI